MGSCTRRHFMLSICLLQMITIIQRQVFDFLGYMWAPILVNFFHIIFIILGFYGAYHFRIKYIITYLIWGFIWIGWNAFLICFYLNVGTLDRDSDLLNLGTGSVSWFEVNGYGCKPTYPVNITSDDPFRPIRPERVDDCLLEYTAVEIVQSGVQCALALFGILGAILISYIFLDEDDRFDFVNGDAKSPQHTVVHPMYVSYSSIPTSASASATLLSNKHHNNHQQALNNNNSNNNNNNQQQLRLQQQLHHHHHHQQSDNFNSNTFLIHTNTVNNNNNNNNHSNNHSHSRNRRSSHSRNNSNSNRGIDGVSKKGIKGGGGGGGGGVGSSNNGQSHYSTSSRNTTLTRMLYSPKSCNKISSSTGNTIAPTDHLLRQQSLPQTHKTALQGAHYYDDSTAKADQLYTNSNRRQFHNGITYQQQQQAVTPNCSTNDNTTSSLSYASLQNSNLNLTQSLRGVGGGQGSGFVYMSAATGNGGGGGGSVGGGGSMTGGGVGGVHSSSGGGGGGVDGFGRSICMTTASSQATLSPLSNSQYSLTNSINNNYSNHSGNNNNNNHGVLNNLNNYINNNNNNNSSMGSGSGVGSGHFARIHSKPKPPKSTSYSSFINGGSGPSSLTTGSVSTGASTTNAHHPDKYSQMSNERWSRNLEEGVDDDTFSLQNFRTEDGITYVPFQKPTPGAAFFVGQNNKNNNPSYVSLNTYTGAQLSPNNNHNNNNNNNNAIPNALNNNNNSLPHFARNISQLAPPPPLTENADGRGEILLERGAILQPAYNYQTQAQQPVLMHSPGPPQVGQGVPQQQPPQSQSLLNPANRFLYQQNGIPFHPAYNRAIPVQPSMLTDTHSSPSMHASYHHMMMSPIAKQPPRPTNIPLPTIPTHKFDTPISPSEVTPPPPPAPRPHIFQPRSGHAPYPDLSPEVTEKYSMPTQYVSRSPVATRIARRQRHQQQQSQNHQHHHQTAQPTTHHTNISVNFCDQVRDAPPGYVVDAGSIVRAKSFDRLATSSSMSGSVRRESKAGDVQSQAQINAEAAPHVNRRSGRRDIASRARPRSYCNSMSGGEGVIRGSLVYGGNFVAESGNSAPRNGSGSRNGSGAEANGGNIVGDQLV